MKEMPSFRDEASRALNRRDDLTRLKERLSFNRDILHADPATKPWLRKTSVPIREGSKTSVTSNSSHTSTSSYSTLDQVKEDASMAYAISSNYSLHTATPYNLDDSNPPVARPRNLSRGTNSSFESEGSFSEY